MPGRYAVGAAVPLTADSARLSSILAPNASFVSPSGVVTDGSDAIAHAVALLRDSSAQRLSIVLGDRRPETCVDGRRDEGLYSIQQVSADGSRSTTGSGAYVAVWSVEKNGRAALRTLLLRSDSTPRSVVQRARCVTLVDRRFDRGRIFITAFPLGFGGANTGSQADATLTSRGWTAPGSRLATARVAAQWHEVTYSAQYVSTGGSPSRYEIVTVNSLNTAAMGPEALVAFTQPLREHAFFEVALASRHGLKTTMQPVPGYDAWTAHFDGESLTIGFGALF